MKIFYSQRHRVLRFSQAVVQLKTFKKTSIIIVCIASVSFAKAQTKAEIINSSLQIAQPATLHEITSIGAEALGLAPYLVLGAGQIIGQWEAANGMPDTANLNLLHNGLGLSRITLMQAGITKSHATNVVLRMVGDGFSGVSGLGYAPLSQIKVWTQPGVAAELATSASGLVASNHSYAYTAGWTPNILFYDPVLMTNVNINWFSISDISQTEDYNFGRYSKEDEDLDKIAKDNPYHSIVIGAGNDRGISRSVTNVTTYSTTDGINYTSLTYSSPMPEVDGGADGYDCIPPGGNGKNTLTIGACDTIIGGYNMPIDVVVGSSSAWGPTDDGRIKPDFVASSSFLTSGAAPQVAGSIALLQELSIRERGNQLRAATIKALLVHTAFEAGMNPGPDYQHGYGLINPVGAADIIARMNFNSQLVEANLTNGNTANFYVFSDGTAPLLATLSWTDPEATPNALSYTPTDLNNRTPKLINDLDTRITRLADNTVFMPYVLDWLLPNNAATNADNVVDNTEKTELLTPTAGWYLVQVSHKGTLAAPQNFSLILSGASNQSCAQIAPISINNVWNGTSWLNTFADGQNVIIDGNLTLPSDLILGNVFVSDEVIIEASIANNITLTVTENAFFGENTKTIGNVNWAGSSAQIICGAAKFENTILELNNTNGLQIKGDNVSLLGDLVLTNGNFDTQNALTLAADVGVYSQIVENGGAISGDITYQMVVSGASGWRNLASPVQTNLQDLLEDMLLVKLANSGGSIFSWDAQNGNWQAPANQTENFDKAFNVFFGTSGSHVFCTLPHTISLTGLPNSGSINNAVYFGPATPSITLPGFNLIANPYPQALDWTTVFAKFGSYNISPTYYIWDANNNNYAASNNGKIAPMQSFYVQLLDAAAENTTAFNFTNANRISAKPTFLKTETPQLILAAQQNGKTDKIKFGFESKAQFGFDLATDGYKLFSPEAATPQLYATFGKEKLAINYVALAEEQTQMALCYSNTLAGDAAIKIDSLSLDESWTIEIEDKLLTKRQNIKNGGYHFWHSPNNDANRFAIHIFKNSTKTKEQRPVVWASGNEIHIALQQTMPLAKVEILNATGQIVYETTIFDFQKATLQIGANGFLVVKITDEKGKVFKEKIIK